MCGSQTQARQPRSASKTSACAGSGWRPRTTVALKVAPCPAALSTVTLPPMSSASLRVITRPSPLPGLVPSCRYGWNSWRCCSGVSPVPVSEIRISSVSWLGSSRSLRTRSTTSPRSVNLIALDKRLVSNCLMRCASPTSWRGTS